MIGDATGAFAGGGNPRAADDLRRADFYVEKAFRAHSPLTRDQQILYDTRVNKEWVAGLQIVNRLIANGQVMPLSRPFAHATVGHYNDNALSGARMARNPRVRTEQDLPDRVLVQSPIFYTFADFSLTIAEYETSRVSGLPLDTNLIGQKARNIAETIEQAVINGTYTYEGATAQLPVIGGATAYGLLNHPDIETQSYGSNGNWDHSSKTIPLILTDLKNMFAKLDLNNQRKAVDLWIPTAWMNAITFMTNTNTDKTALQFLSEVERGGSKIFIGAAEQLPANTAIMYVRDSLAIDLIVGDFGGPHAESDTPTVVPITTIPWQTGDGLEYHWKLISCVVPRPKSTYSSKSGIVKLAA